MQSPACSTCGYDLAGLADDGRCPECAHPIHLSNSEYDRRVRYARLRSLWGPLMGWGVLGSISCASILTMVESGWLHRWFAAPAALISGIAGCGLLAFSFMLEAQHNPWRFFFGMALAFGMLMLAITGGVLAF